MSKKRLLFKTELHIEVVSQPEDFGECVSLDDIENEKKPTLVSHRRPSLWDRHRMQIIVLILAITMVVSCLGLFSDSPMAQKVFDMWFELVQSALGS